MLVGHYAIALAAKALDRKPSLGRYFVATQLIDLVWLLLVAFGVETVSIKAPNLALPSADILSFDSQPVSHSLTASLVWAVAFGALVYGSRWCDRNFYRALIFALVVTSHWWLDLLVHRPDLPVLLSGDVALGAGLWAHAELAFWLELGLLLAAFGLYCARTRRRSVSEDSRDWTERHAAWWPWVLLVALLCVHYVSTHFWPLVNRLPPALGDWVQGHPIGFLLSLLAMTWIGLPVLALLTVDRVRGARI
jgi:hypothetical protein